MPLRPFGATVIVVDASVLVSALAEDGLVGDQARGRLRDERVSAPELIDIEVLSALRRLRSVGHIDDRRAGLALAELMTIPIARTEHRPLLARCWELRDNLSAYDAAYVALAEALGAVLVTADAGLAQVPGVRCLVELLR